MSRLDKSNPNYDYNLGSNYRVFVRGAYFGTGIPKSPAGMVTVLRWIKTEQNELTGTNIDNDRQKIRNVLLKAIDLYLAKNLSDTTLKQFSKLRKRAETFTTLQQFDEIISDGLKLSNQQ
jgi:hypothetical protein